MSRYQARWRSSRTSIAGVLVAALVGCADAPDAPAASTPATRASVDAVSPHEPTEPPFDSVGSAGPTCPALMDSVFLAPVARSALLDAYGEPDSTASVTEPNRYVAGAIDSVFVVYYPGLTVSLVKPPNGPDLPTDMDVTDNRYLRYPSIGIGARAERVLQVLADPVVVTDDRIEYSCGMGADEPIAFWLEDGRVQRVSQSYYVD